MRHSCAAARGLMRRGSCGVTSATLTHCTCCAPLLAGQLKGDTQVPLSLDWLWTFWQAIGGARRSVIFSDTRVHIGVALVAVHDQGVCAAAGASLHVHVKHIPVPRHTTPRPVV